MRVKNAVLALALALPFGAGTASAATEEITIVGTGDGIPILESLGAAFSENNPNVIVRVPPSIGSGGGIKSVGDDSFVLGRVARGIKDKEQHYGLTYQPFAKVPVVFFVHPSAGVRNLSAKQVVDIYSGRITNWSEVGGNNTRIRVVRREDGDSSLSVLRKSFPGFKEVVITANAREALTTAENYDAVERKAGAIGFGPYPGAVQARVDILTIGGASATDPGYPSFTVVALIYKEKSNTGNVGRFISFATSSSAHDAITSANGIPY